VHCPPDLSDPDFLIPREWFALDRGCLSPYFVTKCQSAFNIEKEAALLFFDPEKRTVTLSVYNP